MVPGDLMVNRWVGEHEHFLRDAGPSVARFAPQSGVSLTRALLEDILTRPSAVATLALNWLNGAAVLIEADTLNRMLKRAASLSHPEKPSDGAGEKARSAERRVGKEWVSTCTSWWSPDR